MANQTGKKMQNASPAGTDQGNRPAENKQTTDAVPATGQDRPQGAGNGLDARGNDTHAGGRAASTDEQPMSEKISSTANGILDKAKETASGTYEAVASKATDRIEERKGELSSGLRTLADTFRKTGEDLGSTEQANPLTDITARYTGTTANQIEKVASYFERKDLRTMMRDAEGFARRNPAIFLGAAFALGLAAARFLKSSPPERGADRTAGELRTGLPTALPSGTDRSSSLPANP